MVLGAKWEEPRGAVQQRHTMGLCVVREDDSDQGTGKDAYVVLEFPPAHLLNGAHYKYFHRYTFSCSFILFQVNYEFLKIFCEFSCLHFILPWNM